MEVIEALSSKSLPWKPITLVPFGDLQLGSPGTDIKRIKNIVQWGCDNDVYWLGTGDYTDFLSPSNRRYLKNAGLYDTATELIEEWHKQHMDELKSILKPTIGNWIGLHEGHHYLEYGDGTTSDTDLCRYLEAPFLGTAAVSRLTFRDEAKHTAECLIWSHHGEGATTDPVGKLMKVAPGFPQVDIFISGHNTQIDARPKDTIWFYGREGDLKMREKTQMFVSAGGFMKGYQQGSRVAGRAQGSYVEKAMMRPTAIGAPVIRITPEWEHGYTKLKIEATVGGN